MKTTILTLAVCGSCCALLAQNPAFEWVAQQGGTEIDAGISVGLDPAGNAYATGYFSGTVDFDPGPGVSNLTSMGGVDIFITKLDPSGNLVWAKQIGGTMGDVGHALNFDAAGYLYVTGWYRGTTDFDPGPGTAMLPGLGEKDVFVAKFNGNGNLIWAKHVGGTLTEESRSIALDAMGNLYLTGFFRGTADFDPSGGTANLTTSTQAAFIAKLDTAGNFIWARQMDGTVATWGRMTSVDAAGNPYIAGHFQGTSDFDPGAGVFNMTSAGSWDIHVTKLDAAGNFLWAKQIGNTLSDGAIAMTMDALGNSYVTGWFHATVDFDPGVGVFNMTSAGEYEIFTLKLDGNGNLVWAKQVGGTGYDVGYAATLDNAGHIYSTGVFSGTVDFDPNASSFELTSNGEWDIYISKWDTSGNFVWAKSMGGTSNDEGNAIAVDQLGNVYTTGRFTFSADFDPGAGTFNLTSNGLDDGFLLKMSQSGVGIEEEGSTINAVVYPNPTTGPITVSFKDHHQLVCAQLYDPLGTLVASNTYENTSTLTMDLDIPAGVYFLKLNSLDMGVVFRILKSN